MYCMVIPADTNFVIESSAHIKRQIEEFPHEQRYRTRPDIHLLQYFIDTQRQIIFHGKKYDLLPGYLMFSVCNEEYTAIRPTKINEALNISFKTLTGNLFHLQEDCRKKDQITIPLIYNTKKDFAIRSLFEEIVHTASFDSELMREKANCLIKNLLIIITNQFLGTTNNHSMEKIINAFKNHPTEILQLDQLAKLSDMSKSTLCREFKKYTGKTPSVYQMEFKIKRACSYFDIDESIKVKEAAQMLGFCDEYYFSNVFKSITGVSPKIYKKRHDRTVNSQ